MLILHATMNFKASVVSSVGFEDSLMKTLTHKAVESMRPGQELADSGDFRGLRVHRTTRGWRWYYRYRDGDRLKQHTIGHNLGLGEVRQLFSELKSRRVQGLPLLERKSKPQEFRLDDLIADYVSNLSKRRKDKGVKEAARVLQKVSIAYPNLQAKDFTPGHLKKIVAQEIDAGRFVQVGRNAAEFAAAWDFAVALEKLPEESINPGEAAKKALKRSRIKTAARKRQRYFDDRELEVFLKWLPESGFSPSLRRALMLTLQTGVRSGEAIAAKWGDFDLTRGNWSLLETKTNEPRTIKLPLQTLKWLRDSSEESHQQHFLCPSPLGGHINQKALTERMYILRREGRMPALSHWTPHDLRRTCRTHLSQLGCPEPVAESALGHVVATNNYNLHQYQEEVGVWLQVWNDKLEEISR